MEQNNFQTNCMGLYHYLGVKLGKDANLDIKKYGNKFIITLDGEELTIYPANNGNAHDLYIGELDYMGAPQQLAEAILGDEQEIARVTQHQGDNIVESMTEDELDYDYDSQFEEGKDAFNNGDHVDSNPYIQGRNINDIQPSAYAWLDGYEAGQKQNDEDILGIDQGDMDAVINDAKKRKGLSENGGPFAPFGNPQQINNKEERNVAYLEGKEAYYKGFDVSDNPYNTESGLSYAWIDGYEDAESDDEQEFLDESIVGDGVSFSFPRDPQNIKTAQENNIAYAEGKEAYYDGLDINDNPYYKDPSMLGNSHGIQDEPSYWWLDGYQDAKMDSDKSGHPNHSVYTQGEVAYKQGKPKRNPYGDTAKGDLWIAGWESAEKAYGPISNKSLNEMSQKQADTKYEEYVDKCKKLSKKCLSFTKWLEGKTIKESSEPIKNTRAIFSKLCSVKESDINRVKKYDFNALPENWQKALMQKTIIQCYGNNLQKIKLPNEDKIAAEFVLKIGDRYFYTNTDGYNYPRYAFEIKNFTPVNTPTSLDQDILREGLMVEADSLEAAYDKGREDYYSGVKREGNPYQDQNNPDAEDNDNVYAGFWQEGWEDAANEVDPEWSNNFYNKKKPITESDVVSKESKPYKRNMNAVLKYIQQLDGTDNLIKFINLYFRNPKEIKNLLLKEIEKGNNNKMALYPNAFVMKMFYERPLSKTLQEIYDELQLPLKNESLIREGKIKFEMTGSPKEDGYDTKSEFTSLLDTEKVEHTNIKNADVLVMGDWSPNNIKQHRGEGGKFTGKMSNKADYAKKHGIKMMSYKDFVKKYGKKNIKEGLVKEQILQESDKILSVNDRDVFEGTEDECIQYAYENYNLTDDAYSELLYDGDTVYRGDVFEMKDSQGQQSINESNEQYFILRHKNKVTGDHHESQGMSREDAMKELGLWKKYIESGNQVPHEGYQPDLLEKWTDGDNEYWIEKLKQSKMKPKKLSEEQQLVYLDGAEAAQVGLNSWDNPHTNGDFNNYKLWEEGFKSDGKLLIEDYELTERLKNDQDKKLKQFSFDDFKGNAAYKNLLAAGFKENYVGFKTASEQLIELTNDKVKLDLYFYPTYSIMNENKKKYVIFFRIEPKYQKIFEIRSTGESKDKKQKLITTACTFIVEKLKQKKLIHESFAEYEVEDDVFVKAVTNWYRKNKGYYEDYSDLLYHFSEAFPGHDISELESIVEDVDDNDA